MFISPKRKNAILEMVLQSFILSKLDHQMSKSWKEIAAHELETNSRFDRLKNWVPDCSGQDFGKNFIASKHVLKVCFKPSRKNPDFLYLPLCSVLVFLKIHHLRNFQIGFLCYLQIWHELWKKEKCHFPI